MVAGSSGQISGGALNHPAMYLSLNVRGSMVLDVNGSRLDATQEEIEQNMREAIEFHIDGLRQEGYQVPEPSSYSTYVDIPA